LPRISSKASSNSHTHTHTHTHTHIFIYNFYLQFAQNFIKGLFKFIHVDGPTLVPVRALNKKEKKKKEKKNHDKKVSALVQMQYRQNGTSAVQAKKRKKNSALW
jgi:hypothetical protein